MKAFTYACWMAIIAMISNAFIIPSRSIHRRVENAMMNMKNAFSDRSSRLQISTIGISIGLLFSGDASHAIGQDISYKLVSHTLLPPTL